MNTFTTDQLKNLHKLFLDPSRRLTVVDELINAGAVGTAEFIYYGLGYESDFTIDTIDFLSALLHLQQKD